MTLSKYLSNCFGGKLSLKQRDRKCKGKIERATQSEKRDRLSDLPDSILLHIMEFMKTKHAVQTCVLSKRWNNLWKHLSNLTLDYADLRRPSFVSKFLCGVLSHRDGSIALHNHFNRVMIYPMSHDRQQLTIKFSLIFKPDFDLPPRDIFSCRSLTSLNLSLRSGNKRMTIVPQSLNLPALKSLHLGNTTFTTNTTIDDNDCAEPFSGCNMLESLAIYHWTVQGGDAQVLCISNNKLSSLTIGETWEGAHKIVLSTPNLRSFTIEGAPIHQLSTASDLSYLEKGSIDAYPCLNFLEGDLTLISWLQVLAEVAIMTLSSSTLQLLNDLSTLGSMRAQLPCFGKLRCLKLETKLFGHTSDESVNSIVEFFLQNSPRAGQVYIRHC